MQYRIRDEQRGELIDSNSNVYKAYYTVKDDLEPKILEYIESNLRGQIRGYRLVDVFSKGEEITKLLMEEADAEMEQYGFTVTNIWIADMTSQAQAPNAPQAVGEQSTSNIDVDDSTGSAASPVVERELFLEAHVYTALETFFEARSLDLVSALQIVKMQRKFGREPAPRILVITKSKEQKDGNTKVEMHSLKPKVKPLLQRVCNPLATLLQPLAPSANFWKPFCTLFQPPQPQHPLSLPNPPQSSRTISTLFHPPLIQNLFHPVQTSSISSNPIL